MIKGIGVFTIFLSISKYKTVMFMPCRRSGRSLGPLPMGVLPRAETNLDRTVLVMLDPVTRPRRHFNNNNNKLFHIASLAATEKPLVGNVFHCQVVSKARQLGWGGGAHAVGYCSTR
jgi:hypothetical protein